MKSLQDYIYENIGGDGIHSRHYANKYVQGLNTFYNRHIPYNIVQRIQNGEIVDFINENLQTHDYKTLQNTLMNEYSSQIEKFEDNVGTNDVKSFNIYLKAGVNPRKFKKKRKFRNILLFYNYYYSFKDNEKSGSLAIVPLFPELKMDYIYNECNGICYHFTNRMAAVNILRTGLRCKGGGVYRNFTPRVFVYASKKINLFKEDNKQLRNFITKVSEEDRKYLSILKINLNKLRHKNIPFYKDTCMSEPNALFTLQSIPRNCITDITSEELLDYIFDD